jgi:hypothetical protein
MLARKKEKEGRMPLFDRTAALILVYVVTAGIGLYAQERDYAVAVDAHLDALMASRGAPMTNAAMEASAQLLSLERQDADRFLCALFDYLNQHPSALSRQDAPGTESALADFLGPFDVEPGERCVPSQPNRADDIRESVFRYLMKPDDLAIRSFQTSGSPGREIAFLAIDRADPGDALMQRFSVDRPWVKKASEAIESVAGVRDRRSGAPGIRYNVGRIRWLNENEVKVNAEYFRAGRDAAGCLLRVARVGGRWMVKSAKSQWVS